MKNLILIFSLFMIAGCLSLPSERQEPEGVVSLDELIPTGIPSEEGEEEIEKPVSEEEEEPEEQEEAQEEPQEELAPEEARVDQRFGQKTLKDGWQVYSSESLELSFEHPEQTAGKKIVITEDNNIIRVNPVGERNGLQIEVSKLSEESFTNFIESTFGTECEVVFDEGSNDMKFFSINGKGTTILEKEKSNCRPTLGYHYPLSKRVLSFGLRHDCVFEGGPHGLCLEADIMESFKFQ